MDPKTDLRELLKREINIRVEPQGIDGGRPLRKSAVLVLFGRLDNVMARSHNGVTVPEDLDVLLIRRADRSSYHAGQVAFPGGGVDPEDQNVVAAALREAAEETGLNPEDVEVLGTLPEVPIIVSNNMVTPVIGWWKRRGEVAAVDHNEAVEVFRAPVAELLDPKARAIGVVRRGDLEFRSRAFELGDRFGGHTVWGFTGVILATLFDELGWAVAWDQEREIDIPMAPGSTS